MTWNIQWRDPSAVQNATAQSDPEVLAKVREALRGGASDIGITRSQYRDRIGTPYPRIIDGFQRGKVVPFLGAGVPLSDRGPGPWTPASQFLPSAIELAHRLAFECALPAWSLRDTQNLSRVASYYALTNKPELLVKRLRELFQNQGVPGKVHRFMADIASSPQAPHPLLLVTTNYDTLMEVALQEAGKSFDRVVHFTGLDWKGSVLLQRYRPDAQGKIVPEMKGPEFVEPTNLVKRIDLQETTVLYKMHGSVDCDSFVVTEEHYVEFLSRINGRPPAVPDVLKDHFRECSFLFLGYGLEDWNFRVILDSLKDYMSVASKPAKPTGGAKIGLKLGLPSPAEDEAANGAPRARQHWAVQRDPSSYDRELWQKRHVDISDMDLKEFIQGLQDRWP